MTAPWAAPFDLVAEATKLDDLPDGDLSRFQPLTADEIAAEFAPAHDGPDALRYARRLDLPVRLVLGHPGEDEIAADLGRAGTTVTVRILGRVHVLAFRHTFTCPGGDVAGCGCATRIGEPAPRRWNATVPAATPGAVPVTVIRTSRTRPMHVGGA